MCVQTGFYEWRKTDYTTFIRVVRSLGRSDMARIAQYLRHKSLEEVTEYAEVFSKRYSELEDGDKIMADILKAEKERDDAATVVTLGDDDEDNDDSDDDNDDSDDDDDDKDYVAGNLKI